MNYKSLGKTQESLRPHQLCTHSYKWEKKGLEPAGRCGRKVGVAKS